MKLVNILIERIVKLWLLNLHKSYGKPLLIGAEPYGRIGNRLYLGAHLIAWAQRCNAVLIHTGFHDYEHHFEGDSVDGLSSTCSDSSSLDMSFDDERIFRKRSIICSLAPVERVAS